MVVDVSDDASEEWRQVVGFEGLYEVSNLGRVKGITLSPEFPKPRILKQNPQQNGYLAVGLSNGHRQKTRLVHQLVAEAFIGQRPAGLEVNHRDVDKSNNIANNLEYTTRLENARHAVEHGRYKRGSQQTAAKVTEESVRTVRVLAASMSIKSLAKRYGVDRKTMRQAIKGKTWAHVM